MKKRIFLAVAAVLLMCLTVIAGYQERTFLGARVMPAAQGEKLWAQESTQRLPLNLLGEELPRDEASGVTYRPRTLRPRTGRAGFPYPAAAYTLSRTHRYPTSRKHWKRGTPSAMWW